MPTYSLAENEIGLQSNEVNVEVNPKNPGPHENVTITISSYATDLDKAIISWQTKNNELQSGIGQKKYVIKTGEVDIPIVVNISIKPVGSMDTITKKITIIPSEIDIMWESVDGYTPPFYRGKSLPINGSTIKAVAIPSTNYIKSGYGSITYIWKNNDSVKEDASGYNKNYYIFKNSLFDKNNKIGVIASSVDGNYKAEKYINIPLYKPKIVFYKKSPTESILYNNSIDNDTITSEKETTIVAEPYFFSSPYQKTNSDIVYSWKINDKNIQTPTIKNELTIKPVSSNGYATISLTIENLNELFQKVTNKIKIKL